MTLDFLNNITETLRYKTYSNLVEDLYVKALIESFRRLKGIHGIVDKTENEIRNYLAFDLENHNVILSPFFQSKLLKLTKENTLLILPTETKRTDIEFFISGFGDFIVECKNLQYADQRYILEGANRFVNCIYGKSDTEAALLGFVVKGSINYILATLKKRLENELSFIKGYSHSTEKCSGYEFSFHTSHSRISSAAIILHHLFVDLAPVGSQN